MIFSEKLDFLLKVTNTSNKQLSVALSVDPSLISRMKQGRRKPPQNSAHIVAMAGYFAKKCTTDYQRSALAEVVGQKRIRLIMKPEALAAILEDWLSSSKPSAVMHIKNFMEDLNAVATDKEEVAQNDSKSQIFDSEKSRVYYGNAGKRAATRAFLSHMLKLGEPHTILAATDESLEWVTENPGFSSELYESAMELAKRGCSFIRISPKYSSVDEAVDAFTRWLPVYVTGRLKTYYYPRLRDDLFHQTFILAPGIISVYSGSVGRHVESYATFLNWGADVANVFAREFNDYLTKCLPMTIPHTHGDGRESICDCLRRYMDMNGARAEKYFGLPTFVMPRTLLERILSPNWEYYNIFVDCVRQYDDMLSKENVTTVIRLADPQEVISGRVLCPISMLVPGMDPHFYTASEYAEHLKTLLRTMEKHLDYTVLAVNSDESANTICACEGSACYIMGGRDPFALFEISEQNIISAARAYVLSFSATREGKIRSRKQTIERVTELLGILNEQMV